MAALPSAFNKSGYVGSYWSGLRVDMVAVDGRISEGEVYVVVDLTFRLALRFNSFFTCWLTNSIQGIMRFIANSFYYPR